MCYYWGAHQGTKTGCIPLLKISAVGKLEFAWHNVRNSSQQLLGVGKIFFNMQGQCEN